MSHPLHVEAVKRSREPWAYVERLDTFSIYCGRRCVARVQKKSGAEADAALIVAAVNRLLALHGLEDLRETLKP